MKTSDAVKGAMLVVGVLFGGLVVGIGSIYMVVQACVWASVMFGVPGLLTVLALTGIFAVGVVAFCVLKFSEEGSW